MERPKRWPLIEVVGRFYFSILMTIVSRHLHERVNNTITKETRQFINYNDYKSK